MPVDLAHHSGQITLHTDGQPAPRIVVQGDDALPYFVRVYPHPRGPLPNARILLAAADHVEIERSVFGQQLPDLLLAGRAPFFDENRQPYRRAGTGADTARVSQVNRLECGVQPLPRCIIGPLIGQRFLNAASFGLHL